MQTSSFMPAVLMPAHASRSASSASRRTLRAGRPVRVIGLQLLATLSCAIISVTAHAAGPVRHTPAWPAWDEFAARFMQADGRIIDLTFDHKSTSEGQSYALFFALVANQRGQFDKILAWTCDNLAGGQLGDQLPGWLWGQRGDGSWGLKDANSASDADLWIAYALLEAARLWQVPAYAATAQRLLAQIRRREIARAGLNGPWLLLPAPVGFQLDAGRTRIDPSYLPGFMFRYFAVVDPTGPWRAVWEAHLHMAPAIYKAGVAPDVVVVDSHGDVGPDTEHPPSGSYDAIRVYLWAGMSGPGSERLVQLLKPYARLVRELGAPPEKVNPATGQAVPSTYAPIGYSGAVLPFLHALGDRATLDQQLDRLRAERLGTGSSGRPSNYFDQVLILFGQGWLDGRYHFDAQGRLQPAWQR